MIGFAIELDEEVLLSVLRDAIKLATDKGSLTTDELKLIIQNHGNELLKFKIKKAQ